MIDVPLRPVPRCRGIYDIDRDGTKAEMPRRALWLHPDAAEVFDRFLAGVVTVSDMFRSPDSSLAAVRSGRGAAAPGRSSHNYGRAIDIDVGATMDDSGHRTKEALDKWLAALGWHCWREDHAPPAWRPRPNEAWHYFWAPGGVTYRKGSAVAWWEAELDRAYPARMTERDAQRALKRLGFYGGAIDGAFGPLSRRATSAFQRAWGLRVTSWLDDRSTRCLAFVAWHADWSDAQR